MRIITLHMLTHRLAAESAMRLHHSGGCVIDPLAIGSRSLIVDEDNGQRSYERLLA